jgi:hypothetical protein
LLLLKLCEKWKSRRDLIGGLFSQEAADRFHKQFTAASERSLEKVVSMAVPPTQEGLN